MSRRKGNVTRVHPVAQLNKADIAKITYRLNTDSAKIVIRRVERKKERVVHLCVCVHVALLVGGGELVSDLNHHLPQSSEMKLTLSTSEN